MTLRQVLERYNKENMDADGSLTEQTAKRKATSYGYDACTIYLVQAQNWAGFTKVEFYEYLPAGYLLSRLAEIYRLSEKCFKPVARKAFGKWRSINA